MLMFQIYVLAIFVVKINYPLAIAKSKTANIIKRNLEEPFQNPFKNKPPGIITYLSIMPVIDRYSDRSLLNFSEISRNFIGNFRAVFGKISGNFQKLKKKFVKN